MTKLGLKIKLRGNILYASFSHQGKKFLQSTNIILDNKKHFNFHDRTFNVNHKNWHKDTEFIQDYETKIKTWINEAKSIQVNQVDYVKKKFSEIKALSSNTLIRITYNSELYSSLYAIITQHPTYLKAVKDGNKHIVHDFISVLSLIRDYQIAKNKKLLLSDLDAKLLVEIFDFKMGAHVQHFGKFQSDCDYDSKRLVKNTSQTTLSDTWVNFKLLIQFIEKELMIKLSSTIISFKLGRAETKTPIPLKQTEFEVLMEYKPRDIDEEKVIDFICVSIGTGLDYNDICKLNEEHFIRYNDYFRIDVKRNKTKTKCKIPLTDGIFEIFKKYDFKMDYFSRHTFNKKYKEITKRLRVFNELDKIHAEENNLTEPLKRTEILSHENFRKTYITYCFDLRISEDKIRSRVGHRDSRQMKHYNDNEEKYIPTKIKELMKQIIYVPTN
jgi:integrase